MGMGMFSGLLEERTMLNEQWRKRLNWIAILLLVVCVLIAYLYGAFNVPPEVREQERRHQEQNDLVETARAKGLTDEQIDSALQTIEQANDALSGKEKFPKPEHAYIIRARGYLRLGDVEQAMADFEKTRKDFPESYAKGSHAIELADLLAEKGEYERAVYVYETVIRESPEKENAGYRYGVFLTTTKNKALRDLKRGIDFIRSYLEKNDGDYSRNALATALAANGEFDDAVKHFDQYAVYYEASHEKMLARIKANIERMADRPNAEPYVERQRKELKMMEERLEIWRDKASQRRASFLRQEKPAPSKRY
jgi:tetratricopeptide (TPR) repeat protein